MELKDYLKINSETVSSFADKAGIPQPTVWRILNKKNTSSPKTALLIEQATGGQVTRLELLYPEDKAQDRGCAPKDDVS